jgi:2-polyprenyl-3-methyl-5-hydroxy-6-metoxy-1,4-benzoquinol methylase
VQKLLDVGCGAGAFGERVESLGIKYTGVDASEAAINLGRKHFPGLNLAIVDFAKSPLVPQVADAKFEIVTCINVLHCLTMDADRANLLHNLRQVTMNKGYLILTTMIGPVPLEHQDRRSPRAYRGEDEILVEFAESGWRRLDYELEPPRREFLAGNLTFVGQPCI